MSQYISGRQPFLNVGIPGITTNTTTLNVTGNVGIGTTNVGERSLYVIGNAEVSGIFTASRIFSSTYGEFTGGTISGTSLVGTSLSISGISTLTSISVGGTTGISQYVLTSTGTGLLWQSVTGIGAITGINVVEDFTGGLKYLAMQTGAGTTQTNNISSNQLVYNSTTTNLGIGTTNPTSKLTVQGDGKFTGVVTATTFIGNLTGTATSATFATSAGIATFATSAGIATFATNAGIATFTTNAGIATFATNSGISTFATNSGIATFATSAGIATFATSAGIATFATNSGISTFATNSGIATFATSAGIATFATSAGIATFATNAGIATFATNSGIATFATNAGIATFATNAGIATNIKGGAGGSIPYQSSADTTALLSNGSVGNLLQSNGGTSAPSWIPPQGLTIGYANTAGISTFATSAGIATYTSEWTLGAVGSSDYTFTGPGLIGAESDPVLYLIRGQQYKFTNTMGQHPFRIQSTVNGSAGTQYNDGITNNDVSNGTLTWNVQFDTPSILYYNCTVGGHGGMGGKIYIIDAGIGPDVSVNTTGIITASSFVGTALSISGISTLGTVQISSGIVTATTGIITYYGDGSQLSGVTGTQVVSQPFTSTPVYPILASNSGVSSVGISTTGSTALVFIPTSGNLGIGTTNPTSKLWVNGDGYFVGVVTANKFVGALDSTYAQAQSVGFATTATNLAGGAAGSLPFQNSSGITSFLSATTTPNQVLIYDTGTNKPKWGPVTGTGAISGITVRDEGTNTFNTITTLDIFGSNITATSSSAGIASIRVSDTLVGTALSISGISTFGGSNGVVIKFDGSNGIVTSANPGVGTVTYYGDGSKLTGIAAVSATNVVLANDSSSTNTNIVFSQSPTQNPTSALKTNSSLIFNAATSSLGIGTTNPTSSLHVIGDANIVGVLTATKLSTGASGTGVNISTDTISGPAILTIDPAAVGDNTGAVRIKGDLYVDGTQFVVNSSTIELADLRVGIATTVGTNFLLDGGGIGIGSANILKTFTYNSASDSLKSSENLDINTEKTYKIGGTDVLSSATLGSGVTNSSLTSVGTLGQLSVSGISTLGTVSISSGIISSTTGTAVTFIGNLTGTASYATTSGIATNLAGGGTGSLPYQSSTGITTFLDATTSPNQVLIYNTSTNKPSWGSVTGTGAISGITINNDTSTNASRFLLFTDATSGTVSTEYVSATKLVYNPSSGNLGIGTTTPSSKLWVNGDGYFTGVVTATSLRGYNALFGNASSTVTTFVVTVASKTSNHRYFGTGSANAYFIDGIESPFLTLLPGKTYRFNQESNTNGSHPILFYYQADKTTPYTTNITTSGTPGSVGAYTEIVVTDTTPVVLHYQCSAHGYMGNAAYFSSNVVDTPYQITARSGINVTGVVTATSFVGAALSISGISTFGGSNGVVIKFDGSNGIVTSANPGVGTVTYYGDGSKLSGINASGSVSISTNTANQTQYLTYVTGTGSTTGFGITTTGLVFNPSSGNLGIGTTNSTAKLTVQGNVLISGITTSGIIRISSSTVSPNDTIPVATLEAVGSGSDYDIAIVPKGTGAIVARIPNGAASGGNKRGYYAVDLQLNRGNATQVASNDYAVIAGGSNNTANGQYTFVGAGYGNVTGANPYSSVVGGYNNTTSGGAISFIGGGDTNKAQSDYNVICGGSNNTTGDQYASILGGNYGIAKKTYSSVIGGYGANTRNTYGAVAFAGANTTFGTGSGVGLQQARFAILSKETTDSTPSTLTANGGSYDGNNVLDIPSITAYLVKGSVIAFAVYAETGDTRAWEFTTAIKRQYGSPSLVGTPIINDIAYDSGASEWNLSITADSGTNSLKVEVTGQASTTIRWVTKIDSTEVAF